MNSQNQTTGQGKKVVQRTTRTTPAAVRSRQPVQKLQPQTTEAVPQVQQTRQVPAGAIDLLTGVDQRRKTAAYITEDDPDLLEEEEFDDAVDETWPPRMPTSARRYNPPLAPGVYTQGNKRFEVHAPITQERLIRRAGALRQPQTPALPRPAHHDQEVARPARKVYWLLYVGIGMMTMLVIWQVAVLLIALWTLHQDDATYGRPRTYQFDAVVGHNDSPANPTHFIIVNFNRRVEIIEQSGGDFSHSRVYYGPTIYSDGGDLLPVTGKVADVNGDHKPDLLIYIQGHTIVFLNDGTQFKPAQPSQQNNFTLPTN